MFNHRTNLVYNDDDCYLVPDVHCVPPVKWVVSQLAFVPVTDQEVVEVLHQQTQIKQGKKHHFHVLPCEAVYGVLRLNSLQCALVLVMQTECAGIFSIGSEAHEVRHVLEMKWFRLPPGSGPSKDEEEGETAEDIADYVVSDGIFSEEIERLIFSGSAVSITRPILQTYYRALNDFCKSISSASYLYYCSTVNLAYNPEDILSLCVPLDSNKKHADGERTTGDSGVNCATRVLNRYIAISSFQWNHMLLDAFSFPPGATPCPCENPRTLLNHSDSEDGGKACTKLNCPSRSLARARHATWQTDVTKGKSTSAKQLDSSSTTTTTQERWEAAVMGWSAHLSAGLHSNSAALYAPPVIRGFFGETSSTENETTGSGGRATSYVITRLCCQWAGTRFNRRGLAPGYSGVCGNMAVSSVWLTNNVKPGEGNNKRVAVCDLLRGSIPRYWEQRANITLKPPICLLTKEMKSSPLEELSCHVHLVSRFLPNMSCMLCVDSTSKGRGEAPLSAAYAEGVQRYSEAKRSSVHNSQWPLVVHLQCCVGSYVLKKFTRFSVLRDMLVSRLYDAYVKEGGKAEEWMNFTKWSSDSPGTVSNESTESFSSSVSTSAMNHSTHYIPQSVYFRINCVDCIDRTNIVQSCIISAMVHDMLSYVLTHKETTENHSAFQEGDNVHCTEKQLETSILTLVRDQGYGISVLYAGTTHHLTPYPIRGSVWPQDGMRIFLNMWFRWFQQCFLDGGKQDAVSLLTLQHNPVTAYGKFQDNAVKVDISKFLLPMSFVKLALVVGLFLCIEVVCVPMFESLGGEDGAWRRGFFYLPLAFYAFVQGGLKKNAGVSLTSRPRFTVYSE